MDNNIAIFLILVGAVILIFTYALGVAITFVVAKPKFMRCYDDEEDMLITKTTNIWLALVSPFHMLDDSVFEVTDDMAVAEIIKVDISIYLTTAAAVVLLLSSILGGGAYMALGIIWNILRQMGTYEIES